MTPFHLHTRAALWSLDAALAVLARYRLHFRMARHAGDDLGTLQAWRPGHERKAPPAGHADPLLDAIVRHLDVSVDPLLDRWQRTGETLCWLTSALLGTPVETDPVRALGFLLEELPALRGSTVVSLGSWATQEDQAVRAVLGLGDDHQLIPGVACPACSRATLALRSSGPAQDRTIVCADDCRCQGPGCRCGMTEPTAGVQHIWTVIEHQQARNS